MPEPGVANAIATDIVSQNNLGSQVRPQQLEAIITYALDKGMDGPDIIAIAAGRSVSDLAQTIRKTADIREKLISDQKVEQDAIRARQTAGLKLTPEQEARLSPVATPTAPTAAPTAAEKTAADAKAAAAAKGPGRYVRAMEGSNKFNWVYADGSMEPDINGGPRLFDLGLDDGGANARAGAAEAGANERARLSEAGANERNTATIAGNAALADASNRIAVDQFDRKFTRDSFNSDRDFVDAKARFVATFNQSENQFGASQAAVDRRATLAEQGVNDRFATQYGADIANAQNTYGLTASTNENQYNTSKFSATSADQLSRYNAETNRQTRLSDLATQRERDTRDILSKPSDALARLFFQRQGSSPVAFTSQADLIDRLNQQIKGGLPSAVPAPMAYPDYKAPPAYIRPEPYVPRPSVMSAPYVPTSTGGGLSAAVPGVGSQDSTPGYTTTPGGGVNLSVAEIQRGAQWTPTPGFAEGGLTREPVMRVGDDPSGKPNATEETIVNPTNAPIGVIPNPATVSKLSSQRGADQAGEETALKKKMDGVRKLMQHVDSPQLLHALVDELGSHQSKLSSAGGTPRYALGTLDLNNLNGLDVPTDQNQLLQDAVSSTSPAGESLLSGTPAAGLRFGGGAGGQAPLPSAIQYGRLTGAERDNLNSSLAARYNTDLTDLTDQLEQRYGGTRNRAMARLTVR